MNSSIALTLLIVGSLCRATAGWADSYAFSTLDVPDADITEAFGINDAGQIVGPYSGSNGATHGFSYANGAFTNPDFLGHGGGFKKSRW